MSATRTDEPIQTETANGLVLKDVPFDRGVAYLMETYGLHEDEAREKVKIAKGMKTRQSRAVDE